MNWLSFEAIKPDKNYNSYLVAGYGFFGIGTWENEKGWTEVYLGDFPFGQKGLDKDYYLSSMNIIKYWCEIPEYPE
jgi:hypothetical protein